MQIPLSAAQFMTLDLTPDKLCSLLRTKFPHSFLVLVVPAFVILLFKGVIPYRLWTSQFIQTLDQPGTAVDLNCDIWTPLWKGALCSKFSQSLSQNKFRIVDLEQCITTNNSQACIIEILPAFEESIVPEAIIFRHNIKDTEAAAVVIDIFLAAHSTWRLVDEPYSDSPNKSFIIMQFPTRSTEYITFSYFSSLQYPENCSANTKVFVKEMPLCGFGCTISYIARLFLTPCTSEGYRLNVPFLGKNGGPDWIDPKKCPTKDLSCYFYSESGCPSNIQISNPRSETTTPLTFNITRLYPKIFTDYLNSTLSDEEMKEKNIILTIFYLLRPFRNTRVFLHSLIEKWKHEGSFNLPNVPCMALHLRHGDAEKARIRLSLSYAINVTKDARLRHNVSTIFLMTDGQEVIDEVGNFTDITFQYIPRERARGFVAKHFLSNNIEEELGIMLLEMMMAARCAILAGMQESSYRMLLYLSMCFERGKCPEYIDLVMPNVKGKGLNFK